MKVLVIGGSGTIGQAVVKELSSDTDIITASFSQGDYQVDLADSVSIEKLFSAIPAVDAVICVASRGVVFKSVMDMSIEDYAASCQQKFLGQINVVLQALKKIKDGGSITLTTGVFGHDFVKNGTAAAAVNRAVEGFAEAAALDLPREIRLNVVSPALLKESARIYGELCPGFEPVSGEKVARAYRKSIYGIQTGQIYRIN